MNTGAEKILEIASLACILILQNGGETYRAEEIAIRICKSGGYAESEVLALPTGVCITLVADGKPINTVVKRTIKRGIDLNKLERTNYIARAFESRIYNEDEAIDELNLIDQIKPRHKLLVAGIGAVATVFFILLFGGNFFDCIIGFICGFTVHIISTSFKNANIYSFAMSFIGGIVISFITVVTVTIFKIGNINLIIIGGIIPLLPGLAMINAIRDTMMGDLVSGVARLGEVLLIATSLACGVGVVFYIYLALGGAI